MEDKVAIVTGGGSGIGRASAVAFAKKKVKVAIVDINVKTAEDTLSIIKQFGGEGIVIQADVSNEEHVQNMIKQTIKKYGEFHFCHNNAGIEGEFKPLHEISTKNFEDVMKINCFSIFLCMKYEIEQFLKQKMDEKYPFSIVNTSSKGGHEIVQNCSQYCASKYALEALTKCSALEYSTKNIRINAIAPSTTKTPMVERFIEKNPKFGEKLLKRQNGKIATPEEVAESVIFLSSNLCPFISGTILDINGGN
eukprot:gene3609-6343_t